MLPVRSMLTIGKKVTADNAHALLQVLLPQDARSIYDFHKGFLRHGQRMCVYERPRCKQCPMTDLCDSYKTGVHPPQEGLLLPSRESKRQNSFLIITHLCHASVVRYACSVPLHKHIGK